MREQCCPSSVTVYDWMREYHAAEVLYSEYD